MHRHSPEPGPSRCCLPLATSRTMLIRTLAVLSFSASTALAQGAPSSAPPPHPPPPPSASTAPPPRTEGGVVEADAGSGDWDGGELLDYPASTTPPPPTEDAHPTLRV